jgi:hypothetical protein
MSKIVKAAFITLLSMGFIGMTFMGIILAIVL